MNVKTRHVAVAYDENGKCEFLAKVKVIDDKEYNRLLNEQEQRKARELVEKKELKQQVLGNQEKIVKLDKKLVYLAKSIYDNFVDRGLIENDDDFQQKWYDYYFNNGELPLENTPNEFKKIYSKVVNDYENE